MKKITLFLAFIGMITLNGCTVNEEISGPDYDTISEVFELRNVNFSYNNQDGYFIRRNLNPNIYDSDVILIYRMSDVINANTPVWQLIPRTLYLPQGELDYDFDFSKIDFTIYAGGTYNLEMTPNYIDNQTFRIVIVPGSFKTATKKIDLNNYEDVISKLGIDDSKVKVIK
jgi:hypothetical protein